MANPFSQILSAGQLLRWHGQRSGKPAFIEASASIEAATASAIAAHEATRDVGGQLGTRETGAAFVVRLTSS